MTVSEHPDLVGWLRSSFVEQKLATLDELRARTEAAAGTPRFLALAEQLAARDGTDVEAERRLQSAYAAEGRLADAERVQRRLDGAEPFYVAVCRNRRALLAARIEGDQIFSLTDLPEGLVTRLARAMREVAGLQWWQASGAETNRVLGSPFLRPWLAAVDNEDLVSGTVTELRNTKLILGKCTHDGAVLSSTPLQLLPAGSTKDITTASVLSQVATLLAPREPELSDAAHSGTVIDRPFPEARFWLASVRFEAQWDHHLEPYPAWFRGLVSDTGQVLPLGDQTTVFQSSHGAWRWLRPALASTNRFIAVADAPAMGENQPDGVLVLVGGSGGPTGIANCTFDRSGC